MFRTALTGLYDLPITWSGRGEESVGAMLISPQPSDRMFRVSISTPMGTTARAWIRSCEVSRLG